MAMSLDFVNTVYNDLSGPLANLFYRSTHVLEKLKGSKKKAVGGYLIQRPYATQAPANATASYTGDEVMDMTRREVVTDRLEVDLFRLQMAINVPQREIDRMTSKKTVIDSLIKVYPQLSMEGLNQDFERFFLGGVTQGLVVRNTSDFKGLVTLNGKYDGGASSPTGTRNGVLDYAAPGSQTDSVLGVTKSQAKGIYNQYSDISSWAAEGEAKWRALYRTCSQFDPRKRGPDLMIADDATFGNYQAGKREYVRVAKIKDNVDQGDVLADMFQSAEVVTTLNLNLADFDGNAADGVTYFLNTNDWEFHELVPFKLTPFAKMIANQDVVTSHGTWEGQLICTRFNTQGICTGGAA